MSTIFYQLVPIAIAAVSGYAAIRTSDKAPSNYVSSFFFFFAALMIGIAVSMFVFNVQGDQTKESQIKVHKKLLSLEIASIEASLKDFDKTTIKIKDGATHELHLTNLEYHAMRNAALSGVFNDKISFVMLDIAGNIEFYNVKTNAAINGISQAPFDANFEDKIAWFKLNIESTKGGILKGTKRIKNSLNLKEWGTIDY